MADTYGVKVKLQYQTNKSDLRGQLQSLLDGATQNSPLTIKNFKVSSPGLRKALNAGFKEANTPLTLSNIKLNLSANTLSDLQTQLDSKGLTLTIKEIKADQAVNNLRTQLVRMLSGLQISGVKDFLGGAEIAEQGKALESYVGNLERLKTMRSAISKSGAQLMAFGNRNTTAELQRALVLYRELNDQVSRGIEAKGNWDNIDGLQEELRTLTTLIATHKSYLDSLKQEATTREKNAAAANSANLRELQKMEAALEKINTKGFNLDVDQSKIDVLTEKYNRLYEAIQKAMNTPAMRNNGHSIQELNDGVRALEQYVNLLQAEASANTISLASGRQLITLRTQINNWLQKNTKATQANRTQLQKWAEELALGNVSTSRYTEIANGVKQIDLQTRQAGLSGKTFFDTFKAGLEKFGGWSLVTRSLTAVYNTLKKMVNTVIELDSAMTELRRVTDLTEANYAKFMQTAISTAKEVGASVKDTINATADFARLGYTVDEATQLAAAALTYKNIGDGIDDISTATESLISTMKAFGIEAGNSMYVVDMFNEVGNNFAISSKGIGDALQRSAAALAEGGNTIQESIGLITAANEIIQDPDVIGTAMKTLTMYLRAAKTEAEEAGVATDGMASSVSELRDELLQLTGNRVDIMIDDTTFKSTYQIMEDLASIWKELDDITRSNILNLIGGKRNANTFSALLNNFETAAEAVQAAMGAAGSAILENEEYLKSIQGRIVQLKTSFEELSNSVINSSLVKWFVEIARYATELATILSDIGVLWPAVFAGAGLKGLIQQFYNVKKQFSTTVQDIFTMSTAQDGSVDIGRVVKSLTEATKSYTDVQKVQFAQLLQNSDGFNKLTADQQANMLSQIGLQRAVSASTTGFKAFGVSIKQAWAAMSLFEKASVIMAIISAIYTVISSVVGLFTKLQDDAKAAREESIRTGLEAGETARELSNNVMDATERFVDLNQQIDSGIITNEQYTESVYDIISGLRKHGETVDGLITKYGNLRTAMLETSKRQLKEAEGGLIDGLDAAIDQLLGTKGIFDFKRTHTIEPKYGGIVVDVGSEWGIEIPIYNEKVMSEEEVATAEKALKILKEYGVEVTRMWGVVGRLDTIYGRSAFFPEIDTVEELVARRDLLYDIIDKFSDVAGAEDTEFYKNIHRQYSQLNELVTQVEQYVADWNENQANQLLIDIEIAGVAPKTQAEFDEMRKQLIEQLQNSGVLKSLTGDLNIEATNAVDSALANQNWALPFLSTLYDIDDTAGQTNEKVRTLTDAISEFNTAVNLMKNLRSGDTLSVLENIMSLVASGAHINMSDFFDEQGLKNADDILTSITNTLLQNLEELAAQQGITWNSEWTTALREQLANAGVEAQETEKDVRSLTDAISEYNTAVSLMENLRAGDTLSVLENIMSLVASGAHINMSDFFDEQGLKSADDILTSITNTLLQNLEELAAAQGITWNSEWTTSLREQLANAGVEVDKTTDNLNEQVTAYERLTEAATKANSAIANAPAQGDLVPLTKEAYDELIALDSRYASAVQYQNGVLTLNRDAYAAVTQQILQNTKAQAAAEIQAIVTSDKYLDLTRRIGSLDAAEQQQLDSLNAEIMGYSVLIHELENATSAYQRFINASSDADSGRYSAAENARKVIQDTLYDVESEIYGKIGREQYVAAIDFLIDPDIKVGTADFDVALKTIDRYLEEGTSGVRNFYDDLIQHGFIDSNGVLNASMAEMADKLGVSMEFLRSMFDELNMYQDEEHKVKIECDTGDVETEALSAEEQLAALQAAASSLNETLDVDHTIAVDTDPANTSLGKVSSTLSSIISKLNSISGRRVTTYVHTVTTSSEGASGAASAGGTRSAVGGRTLVGELGMETVVDPNTGSWYTVGKHGAEFVDLPKGAIVFNAGQTRRLFQAGRINSRGNESGQAMVAGGLVGSSTTPFFSMVAAEVGAIVPSIVEGVVSGVVDQASGSPVMPPADTDSGKKDPPNNRPDPSKKIEEMSDAFEEANKYMEHLIRHQEHLYEVAENGLDFPGMEASLTEQARLYREMMSKAQQTVQQMIAAGAKDTDEALQKVEESYWSAYSSLYDVIGQINALYVDALNDKIDGIQSSYSTFSTMIEEMGQDGKITVDTFQELVANGLEYLNYLELVDGQYVINQEALEKMIASEKEQLAIEQALAYIAQIRQALSDDDPEKVANLVNLTNQISNNTWDLVYANAALLKTMGLTDDEYASVIHNIDMMKSLTGQVNTSLDDGSAAYESQQDALDKILDYTEQLIQYETEEKIKAIEDEIDAYEELVNLRKEALKTAKDEADYSNDIANRTKEIAALEARIAQLSLDDSREAKAERAALEAELAQLQGDLADVQGDHAYEKQVEALDKDAEDYRQSREEEIAALEASISSREKLYQAALQRIDTRWDTLYTDLMTWNSAAGRSLNSEITSNWELALGAAEKYGSYVDAIVAHTGNPVTVTPVKAEELPIAHEGGIISTTGVAKDEVLTLLETDEEVLTKKQRSAIYRIVDFAKELSNRLGTAIKDISLPFSQMTPALAGVDGVHGTVVSNQNSMHFSPEITVQITHNGDMSDSDARSYGRQIGNIAMKEMQNAFERRGISGVFGGNLRQ